MTDYKKEFLKKYQSLCGRHNRWEVWQDFVTMSACAIANSCDWDAQRREEREKLYLSLIKKYYKAEQQQFPAMLADVTMALDENPEQDFLGEIFMDLDFGGDHGQFFTPYCIAELMSELSLVTDSVKDQIKLQGYISVNDCACGAGVMLIAFANTLKHIDVNYQNCCLFVAQDIDQTVAKMCYIQLSLLGCPGYVYVGNTFTEPICGDPLSPVVQHDENLWYTPLYFVKSYRFTSYPEQQEPIKPIKMPSKQKQKEICSDKEIENITKTQIKPTYKRQNLTSAADINTAQYSECMCVSRKAPSQTMRQSKPAYKRNIQPKPDGDFVRMLRKFFEVKPKKEEKK